MIICVVWSYAYIVSNSYITYHFINISSSLHEEVLLKPNSPWKYVVKFYYPAFSGKKQYQNTKYRKVTEKINAQTQHFKQINNFLLKILKNKLSHIGGYCKKFIKS